LTLPGARSILSPAQVAGRLNHEIDGRRAMRVARAWCMGGVLTAALWAGAAWAQSGTVSGTVTDSTGAPVSGAEVRVDGTMIHGLTDAEGRFTLSGVPAGSQTIRALLLGYKSARRSVTVEAGATVTVDIQLERSVIPVPGVEIVLGSRARHTAADELAVPVDVFPAEEIRRQGTTETSQALQSLAPSVNFPHQSVTDATDIVRPFTLRGLSPDQTLVLVNGLRRHQTALVNTFAYGMPAGSSGVDLNAIPSSAIDRIEVLRDGAAAQYGSDAIAGVVDVVTKRGRFAPSASVTGGEHFTADYPRDGKNLGVSGAWGLPLGPGSVMIAVEYLNRDPTNRAWADTSEVAGTGLPDTIDHENGKVITKRNPVPQPNHHWGDGLEQDVLTMADLHLPIPALGGGQVYAFGGYSHRLGNGEGYRRYAGSDRNWDSIYPLGYLPQFRPKVTDFSAAGGVKGLAGGWNVDGGASYGHNGFRYDLRNTLNASLGGSLTTPTAPGPDSILGNADDPGIPNQTSFFAGELRRDEVDVDANASREMGLGLPNPVNVAVGAAFRVERWRALRGELASYIDGGSANQNNTGGAPGGSQVFPGFAPSDESNSSRNNVGAYVDLESDLTRGVLADAAARFENYSDFGSVVTGKLAARWQPARQLTLRAAGSTGFRAPGLGQIHFSKVVTNFIGGNPEEVGVFPVDHPAAKALGSRPLKEEKSVNVSAGFAVTPVENLTLTVDGYDIRITDRILLGATFDDATTQSILAAAGYGGVLGVQYFTNGIDTKTQGVDVTGTLRTSMEKRGSLAWRVTANYGKTTITHVDPLPAVLAGSSEPGLLDEVTRVAITKERPDWRGTFSAEYTLNPLRALVRASYYGVFASAQPAFTDGYTEHYPARTLVDAEAGYGIGPVELAIGGRNLVDTYPGRARLDYNNNFDIFPWAAASPFGYNGRFLYSKVTWTMPQK
jgi:iron complex outermembrane receptor protein